MSVTGVTGVTDCVFRNVLISSNIVFTSCCSTLCVLLCLVIQHLADVDQLWCVLLHEAHLQLLRCVVLGEDGLQALPLLEPCLRYLILSKTPAKLIATIIQQLPDSIAHSQDTAVLLLYCPSPPPPPLLPLQPGSDLPDLVAGAPLIVIPGLSKLLLFTFERFHWTVCSANIKIMISRLCWQSRYSCSGRTDQSGNSSCSSRTDNLLSESNLCLL